MRHYENTYRSRQSGVGLVEIMVGLAVGLITALIVMQVMTAYDQQKRTATSGTDAQTNGSIALYMIQRQLQLAGFALPVSDAKNCNGNILFDHDKDASTPDISMNISPVYITDGGDAAGASDTIVIQFGNSATGGIPFKVLDDSLRPRIGLANNLGCNVNDKVIIVDENNSCWLDWIVAIPDNGGTPSTTDITLRSGAGAALANRPRIACLGNWGGVTYSVVNGNLLENGTPIMANVVSLQAQYGISNTPNNNTVTGWVDATGTWANPGTTDRNRIKAIRVAVVASSGQPEAANISSACSSLTTATPTGVCAWPGTAASPAPGIDLSNIPNWQRYRYRVFDTIVPLRNVVWS